MLYNISRNFKLVYFVVNFYLSPFIFLSVFAVKIYLTYGNFGVCNGYSVNKHSSVNYTEQT